MTLTLELPAELETALTEKAAQRGVPLNALILDAVTQYAAREENGAARRAEIRALPLASPQQRAAALQESARAAAQFYATPAGREELADWRALDGEAFHED